jgi:GNAT superfamily N-acetyltransferase
MVFKRTTGDDKDFIKLTSMLDSELYERYGELQDRYNQYNRLDSIKHVIILYDGNSAAGCGSFKEYDSASVELKRMFLKREFRGSGVASTILNELEKWAIELGYGKFILETGIGQPDAIKFYVKSGYTQIENFGQYIDMKESVCMSKNIL